MIEVSAVKLRDIQIVVEITAAQKGKLVLAGAQIGIVAAERGAHTARTEWFFVPLDDSIDLLNPQGPAIDVSDFFELFVEDLALIPGIPERDDFLLKNHVYDWDTGTGCVKILFVGRHFVSVSAGGGYECGDLISGGLVRDTRRLLRIGRLVLRVKD